MSGASESSSGGANSLSSSSDLQHDISGASESSSEGANSLSSSASLQHSISGALDLAARGIRSLWTVASRLTGRIVTFLSPAAAMQLGMAGASESSSRGANSLLPGVALQLGTSNATGSSMIHNWVASGAVSQMNRDNNDELTVCGYCDTKVVKKDELEHHNNQLHRCMDRYLCTKCGHRYYVRDDLDWHAGACQGKEPEPTTLHT